MILMSRFGTLPEINRLMRVQMLLTDGFGGFGGISRFNRDFLSALNVCPLVERVYALPRIISDPIEEPIPEAVVYERRAARGRVSYALAVIRHALRGPRADLVICGHINLLPLAWARSPAGACAFGACHPRLRGMGAILAQTFERAGQSDRRFYRGQPLFG